MQARIHALALVSAFSMGCATAPTARVVAVAPPQSCPPSAEASPSPVLSAMNLDRLDELLRAVNPEVRRQGGAWELTYQGVPVMVITDEHANRMRMVTPIAEVSQLTAEHLQAAMVANFHTALDARYAVGGGVLFAVYIHSLSTLNELDVESAVRQTATLAATFGSEYTSGEMVFGAQ